MVKALDFSTKEETQKIWARIDLCVDYEEYGKLCQSLKSLKSSQVKLSSFNILKGDFMDLKNQVNGFVTKEVHNSKYEAVMKSIEEGIEGKSDHD